MRVIAIPLIAIAGLRSVEIGLDTYQYYSVFTELQYVKFDNLFHYNRWEEGYMMLNWLLRDTSFVILQVVTTTILIVAMLFIAKRYSPYIWLTCLLFVINSVYYRCFNEMRQTVSMGILCFAFISIIDKKIWRFIILTIIASFFHRTCLIFLPTILLIYVDEIKPRYFLILIALLVFTSLYSHVLIQYSLSLVSSEYVTMEDETGGWGFFILNAITIGFIFLNRESLLQDRVNIVLTYFLFINLILFPICHLNPVFFRLSSYFGMFSILLIPRIYFYANHKILSAVFVIGYCLLQFYFNYLSMYSERNLLLPYKFFWE